MKKQISVVVLSALFLSSLVSCGEIQNIVPEGTDLSETTAVIYEDSNSETTTEQAINEETTGGIQGFTENENGLLSPDFTPASIDLSRSLKMRIKIADGLLTFVAEVRDSSSPSQRYALKAKNLKFEANGETVIIESEGGLVKKTDECDSSFLEYDASEENLDKLLEMSNSEEINVTVNAVNEIIDVSSPFRNSVNDVSCSLTLCEDDIAILKDAINYVK